MSTFFRDFRQKIIKYAYYRWSKSDQKLDEGYTILIPIPSDLPVFLSLALEIINKQDLTDAKEILIIPDWPSVKFEKFFVDIASKYKKLPIRLISLGLKDLLTWTLAKSITTRHFTQVMRGIEETNTKYAIIHDSDAFLRLNNFIKKQYETCRNRKLAVFGVSTRRSMMREDREIFVSTWELVFSVSWAKSFPPFMHRGQFFRVNGKRQEFDTMLLPQYLTDMKLIDWIPRNDDYFHFGYVIATYRKFLNRQKLLSNYGLKLFLIRSLIDVFDESGWNYPHIPKHSEFLEGNFGLNNLKIIPDGMRHFHEFRDTLNGIIKANIFSSQQNEALDSRLKDLFLALKIESFEK